MILRSDVRAILLSTAVSYPNETRWASRTASAVSTSSDAWTGERGAKVNAVVVNAVAATVPRALRSFILAFLRWAEGQPRLNIYLDNSSHGLLCEVTE